MLQRLGKNIRWGVMWGLYLALGFTAIAAVPTLIRVLLDPGDGWQKGLTFLQIIGVYLFGGVAAGSVVGVLRPLVRFWLGRRLVGIIAGAPIVLAVRIAVYGTSEWTTYEVQKWVFTALVWGFVMSFAPEPWAKGSARGRKSDRNSG